MKTFSRSLSALLLSLPLVVSCSKPVEPKVAAATESAQLAAAVPAGPIKTAPDAEAVSR